LNFDGLKSVALQVGKFDSWQLLSGGEKFGYQGGKFDYASTSCVRQVEIKKNPLSCCGFLASRNDKLQTYDSETQNKFWASKIL
jgi:hypothetical protein